MINIPNLTKSHEAKLLNLFFRNTGTFFYDSLKSNDDLMFGSISSLNSLVKLGQKPKHLNTTTTYNYYGN